MWTRAELPDFYYGVITASARNNNIQLLGVLLWPSRTSSTPKRGIVISAIVNLRTFTVVFITEILQFSLC